MYVCICIINNHLVAITWGPRTHCLRQDPRGAETPGPKSLSPKIGVSFFYQAFTTDRLILEAYETCRLPTYRNLLVGIWAAGWECTGSMVVR